MQYERSISATYYLLQGKQSIQTIQDANLFGLTPYYGIYKNLAKDRFFELVQEFEQNHMLQQQTENYYNVTEKGKRWLQNSSLHNHYLNGVDYKQFDEIYFKRLLLLIQVWTNSKKQNYTYVPIIENTDIENWVKRYYTLSKKNLDDYLHLLYKELVAILSLLPAEYPAIFLDQFTSYQIIGLTTEQIATKFRLTVEDIHVTTIHIIHFMLKTVQEQASKYKLLYFIGKDLFPRRKLTNSAEKTSELLHQGLSITEIASIRKLKVNTIYDHIVEIALHDKNFPLSLYVPKPYQEQIIQAIKRFRSYKLKDIKVEIDENITYFQIRLVLAKINEWTDGSGYDEAT